MPHLLRLLDKRCALTPFSTVTRSQRFLKGNPPNANNVLTIALRFYNPILFVLASAVA